MFPFSLDKLQDNDTRRPGWARQKSITPKLKNLGYAQGGFSTMLLGFHLFQQKCANSKVTAVTPMTHKGKSRRTFRTANMRVALCYS